MAEFKWYGMRPDAAPPSEFILRLLLERTGPRELLDIQDEFKRECSELVLGVVKEFIAMWEEGLRVALRCLSETPFTARNRRFGRNRP